MSTRLREQHRYLPAREVARVLNIPHNFLDRLINQHSKAIPRITMSSGRLAFDVAAVKEVFRRLRMKQEDQEWRNYYSEFSKMEGA